MLWVLVSCLVQCFGRFFSFGLGSSCLFFSLERDTPSVCVSVSPDERMPSFVNMLLIPSSSPSCRNVPMTSVARIAGLHPNFIKKSKSSMSRMAPFPFILSLLLYIAIAAHHVIATPRATAPRDVDDDSDRSSPRLGAPQRGGRALAFINQFSKCNSVKSYCTLCSTKTSYTCSNYEFGMKPNCMFVDLQLSRPR